MSTPAPAQVPEWSKKDVFTDGRFWIASSERAFFTFFQTLAAELAVTEGADIAAEGLGSVPWTTMVSVSAFAALTSFVTSLGKVAGGAEGPGLSERLRDRKPRKNRKAPAEEGASDATFPEITPQDTPAPTGNSAPAEDSSGADRNTEENTPGTEAEGSGK